MKLLKCYVLYNLGQSEIDASMFADIPPSLCKVNHSKSDKKIKTNN